MTTVAIAVALMQTPPLPKAPPMVVTTEVRGYGEEIKFHSRVTVHFVAATEDGEVVVDTEKRGMPFTFLFGQDTVEGFWHTAVEGARVGEVRSVRLTASAAGAPIEGDPNLVMTLKVVAVSPL